jgi:glycosyltransferase involved in cell wall biosynthesis
MAEFREGLVSVIVPVFNREGMIGDALRSALAQTHGKVEVIVVDDGSTDGTLEVVRAIAAEDPARMQVLSQSNRGPGAARNLGLSVACGEFIQYLDSDDLLEPRKFEWQVAALRANPGAGLAYGLSRRTNLRSGESRIWARTAEAISSIFPDFLMRRGWDTNCPLWRRSATEAIGPWADFRCLEDWEHDLRAGLLGIIPVQVTGHVATVRDHSGSRAGGGAEGYTQEFTRNVFLAHVCVWERMAAAGRTDWSYLRSFARKMFWVARMCGGRGLDAEASKALSLAEEMTRLHHKPYELRAFGFATRMFGWHRTVAVGNAVHRLLRRSHDASAD